MGRQIILSENEKLNIQKMYGLINEQSSQYVDPQLKQLEELKSNGYVDVTESFNRDEYSLEVEDGENYKVIGSGYQHELFTNDMKETGYLFLSQVGVRGATQYPATVYDNGIMISFPQEFIGIYGKGGKLFYNETKNKVKKKK